MQVNKIKMKKGRLCSYNPLDIQGVYIDDIYYCVEEVYDYIASTGDKIYIKGKKDVYLVNVLALNGSKYLRTTPNESFIDNLLNLPRE